MNTLKKTLRATDLVVAYILGAVAALLTLGSLPAMAQNTGQYGYTTLLEQGSTNLIATAAATNLTTVSTASNGVVLTKYNDFVLNVDGYTAGALTNGMIDVRWSTSVDGMAWQTNCELKSGSTCGWFSMDVNTGGNHFMFNTNITVGALGYWRIDFLTNRTGLTVSNTTIRAYLKPTRRGT